ncbi:bifunctional lytic transglycosylase/C40 family peptidase [Streptomyces chrestomyceticus]|uniref:C40 family peptidase n=1 Tax=Streptomyces chrestomyceticus TaxID=68185 RepID=UPI0033C1490B
MRMRRRFLSAAAAASGLALVASCGMVDGGSTVGGLSDAVPARYRAWITKAGSICSQIPPAIIAAQIEAESGWNPNARSPVGALGLSQFMPGTWAAYGVDGNGDGKADPFEPADAILSQGTYDCVIAKELLPGVASKKLRGDIVSLTLAGYNAGSGAVWKYGGVPPYWETQGYVARILKLAQKYQGTVVGGGPVGTGTGARAVAAAKKYLGAPYIWGGGGAGGPTGGGFDCSGLTQYAIHAATGKTIPRTSQSQRGAGTSVPRNAMQPGDVIVINNDGNWGHVGLYAGNGQMIHAPHPGTVVKIVPLDAYWQKFPWDVRRFT